MSSVSALFWHAAGTGPGPSAWELACHALPTGTSQISRYLRLSVSARRVPVPTLVSGTQRARGVAWFCLGPPRWHAARIWTWDTADLTRPRLGLVDVPVRGDPCNMAWEWVGAVATAVVGSVGVTFTWLTGSQSRKQVERMAVRAEIKSERERLIMERRNAYLATMSITRLDIQRFRYHSLNETAKLEEFEKSWPRAQRLRMAIDAETALDAFGSQDARDWQARSHKVYVTKNFDDMQRIYKELLILVRNELGTTTFTNELEDLQDLSGYLPFRTAIRR
jgi:hypothetical protein